MSTKPPRKHPSTLRRDTYLLGALSPDDAVEIEAHLRECPDCRADFAAQADAIRPGAEASPIDRDPRTPR